MVSLSNESYRPVTRMEGNNDIHGLSSLTGCLEWASLLFTAHRHRTAGRLITFFNLSPRTGSEVEERLFG
jgi:hypothetical protein